MQLKERTPRFRGGQLHGAAAIIGADRDASLRCRQVIEGIEGIAEEQDEQGLESGRVCHDCRQRCAQFHGQPHGSIRRQRLDQRQRGAYQAVEIKRQAIGRKGAGHGTQLPDHFTGPQRLAGYCLDDAERLQGPVGIATEQRGCTIRIGRDSRQRLIQFVGKTGSEVPQQINIGSRH